MGICVKVSDSYLISTYVMSVITFKDKDVGRAYC